MCIHEQLLLIAYQFAMRYSLATLKKKKKFYKEFIWQRLSSIHCMGASKFLMMYTLCSQFVQWGH